MGFSVRIVHKQIPRAGSVKGYNHTWLRLPY
jgi:hypothetical protein